MTNGTGNGQRSATGNVGSLSDEDFESVVADAHDKVARAVRNAVREVELRQEQKTYAQRTEQGCTVADLEALAASGFKAGVIVPDFPWSFDVYSSKGRQRSADRHYDTWSLERILAMGPLVRQLAADDCVLMPWGVCPQMPGVIDVITACGFQFKTFGFFWLKTTPSAERPAENCAQQPNNCSGARRAVHQPAAEPPRRSWKRKCVGRQP